jgi:hypothetical protein
MINASYHMEKIFEIVSVNIQAQVADNFFCISGRGVGNKYLADSINNLEVSRIAQEMRRIIYRHKPLGLLPFYRLSGLG